MNLYSFFDIEHNSNLNVPSTETIANTLNDIVTPKLSLIGLSNKQKKYIWQGVYNAEGIKPIIRFKYRNLNTAFFVGVNFSFIPSLTQNKKTAHYNYALQVYENSKYFEKGYSIRLWNKSFFRQSLQKFINSNFRKISKFLIRLDSLEANITLAENQFASKKYNYRIYNPELPYVLAHLYHRQGNMVEALKMKTLFLKENEGYDDSIFKGFI
ncbi:hypothetical protein [uncultured Winogradskyella sp.]|uniref:hypothetical protein n=1 Tax=uncultured Winogradskyella sp. TaxID=395353 RepID=UPI0026201668|nr:hypothetical protein [uncultured Winogradskyella sp.]